MMHHFDSAHRRASLLLWMLIALGCSEAAEQSGGGERHDEDVDPPDLRCAPGEVLAPGGACMAAGIQGCAEQFIDPDTLCRPTLSKCPGSTIPKFDEGCIPVGIARCAPEFMDAARACRPPPGACGEGAFAVPSAGCLQWNDAAACGEGTWGAIAEQPGDMHVDGSAAADGDGSRARPFDTIAAAIAAARDGGRVVIAAGDYDEPLILQGKDLDVRGRCAALVTIHGTSTLHPRPAIVTIERVRAALQGFRIQGDGFGIEVSYSAVQAQEIAIVGALDHGVHVEGSSAELTLTRSLVSGTRGTSAVAGVNIWTGVSGKLRASGVMLRDGQLGVAAATNADVHITDSVIEVTATPIPSQDTGGVGVYVDGAIATIDNTAILGSRGHGVWATGARAHLTLANSLVEAAPEALAQVTGKPSAAVVRGARGTFASTVFAGSTDVHLFVDDAASELTVSGSLLQGPSQTDARHGFGIQLLDGRLVLEASAIAGALDAGIDVHHRAGSGPVVIGRGVIVEGTVSRPAVLASDIASGMGVMAEGASGFVQLTSSYIADNHVNGAYVVGGIALDLSESLVEGPPASVQTDSTSLVTCDGASSLRVTSSALLRGRGIGLMAQWCPVTLDRLWIDGMTPSRFEVVYPPETLDDIADGILARNVTNLDARNVRITGCERAGLLSDDSEGVIASSELSQNRFGIVLQGSRRPVLAADTSTSGNTEGDQLSNETLPVPGRALPVP